MKTHFRRTGFTIIELLVVVSIIGLLLSLLIPAVGKARDSALTTQSLANLRNMSAACGSYGADWSDRQVTFIFDDLAQPLTSITTSAEAQYRAATGACPPSLILGYGGYIGKCNTGGGIWAWWTCCEAPSACEAPSLSYSLPIILSSTWNSSPGTDGAGAWRTPNARSFSQYINSKFYDKVFYAPKDKYTMERAQPAFEKGDDFAMLCEDPDGWIESTYCFSPAAMFGPDAFGSRKGCISFTGAGLPPAIFRSPSVGQAAFPDLKTRMLEHQWLQNKEGPDFNPKFSNDTPYFFNQCVNSAPATLFYDGHVSLSGCNDSMSANAQVRDSNGLSNSTSKEKGLYANDTISTLPGPWGNYGGYFTGPEGKEGANFNYDTQVNTSFHVFTIDGILGRDFLTAK
ncbi:MAG: prepilin-type N-terminal cleavage/methylation domain-containing protein [Planctomycetes bacterium]|nr:prepilin-type N-terminal cleavage/methylation domain-containing protein [Planctomycetota bacterium]